MADNWSWTFTDTSGLVVASGTLSGSSFGGGGGFNITSGGITDNLYGSGTIFPNPSPGAVGLSPGGTTNYDNLLFPGTDPLVDNWGLLFVGPAHEYNIYSNTAPITYLKFVGTTGSGGSGPDDVGTFAIVSTPDGGTTLALLGLALVGLAGIRRKLSL
jgi:hypothetical protein